jgi:DNA-binding winged helix-turn-helix (wHTH) protein
MRRWGPLRLDASTSEVHWGSTPVRLTVHQFHLLDALVAARGATVSADRLARALYGRALQSDLDRIRAHVARLRQRLEVASPDAVEIVVTVRARGYRVVLPGQSYQAQIDVPATDAHPPPQVLTRVGHAGPHRGQLACAGHGSVSELVDRHGGDTAAVGQGDGWRTA